MSNVYRAANTFSKEGNVKEITIKTLNRSSFDEEQVLTQESLMIERNRLLQDAQMRIETEKSDLAQIRQTALEDIAAMQSAWEQEKTNLQQQAYEEGFQQGYEEGRNKSLSDMNESVKIANEITAKSHENALKYIEEQEKVILEIAMKTAERILGTLLENDEEKFLSIVKKGLKEVREMKEVKLYVSIAHFDFISSNRDELMSIFPPEVPFLIFVNDDFDVNDCIIETNQGRIVVSVDEQLNMLKEQLFDLMESGD
ncbi:flagellar assembly protein FliH [Sporosarcina thermotolerans]|uniref:Flagellar assembly protein FliH n=1 Tax=Sporosarcina thermotolerans TaxID=633404 RepID=A0AAW9A7G6_9BACL|nr:flagellar assembly protein FliH [Sporosarcina thermotolerans]MDW0115735.1 flagellar assembly protein FliH [Sporosarcina thermotolerans]WHT47011.1 flagellar assembly protein FliH [Sporosarcina thermotolerans]